MIHTAIATARGESDYRFGGSARQRQNYLPLDPQSLHREVKLRRIIIFV